MGFLFTFLQGENLYFQNRSWQIYSPLHSTLLPPKRTILKVCLERIVFLIANTPLPPNADCKASPHCRQACKPELKREGFFLSPPPHCPPRQAAKGLAPLPPNLEALYVGVKVTYSKAKRLWGRKKRPVKTKYAKKPD